MLDAPFATVHPARRDPAARSAASTATTVLAHPILVDYHGARLGALTTVQLARALRIVPRDHRFVVKFDGDALARAIRPRLGRWFVHARNAQFAVDGDAVHVVSSKPGRDVDPTQVAVAVTSAAHADHVARVELGSRAPELTTARADELGITTKLVSFTTQMGASSSNRIHNVHLMADFIDGTVIRPGETFSYNKVVGPRTADRGFLEGQEIIGSLVLPSIGGGVCQTATTLFNDAFELGLPILERTNHNLYLSHYPLGRDATVSWGGPDLVFRNDLKHGLLIEGVVHRPDPDLHLLRHAVRPARRLAHRAADELDAAQALVRGRSDRSARLDASCARHRRARVRRRRDARRVHEHRQAAPPQRLQVALHPRQPDGRLRPGTDAARPLLRDPVLRLSVYSAARRRSWHSSTCRTTSAGSSVRCSSSMSDAETIPSANSSPRIQSTISLQ